MVKDDRITLQQWMSKVFKELHKHAERDDCYGCKRLLDYNFIKRFEEAEKP